MSRFQASNKGISLRRSLLDVLLLALKDYAVVWNGNGESGCEAEGKWDDECQEKKGREGSRSEQ